VTLEVPLGTIVKEINPSTGQETLIADLEKENQSFTVVRGGQGGRGNTHFASGTHNNDYYLPAYNQSHVTILFLTCLLSIKGALRSPQVCEHGKQGEEKILQLELKTIADVGLVVCVIIAFQSRPLVGLIALLFTTMFSGFS
jgi:GTP-binding protein